MLTFTTGDLGSGIQLTQLANSECTVNLAEHPLAAVETRNIVDRTTVLEDTSTMNLVGSTITAEGFTLEFESSNLVGGVPHFYLVLNAVVDNTAGVEAITITPTITMGAGAAPSDCFHYVSIETRIPLFGALADGRVSYPAVQNNVVWWGEDRDPATAPFVVDVERGGRHPGTIPRGGTQGTASPGLMRADQPTGKLLPDGIASLSQLTHFYDRATAAGGDGLVVRTTDIVGRYKTMTFERKTGDDIIYRVHMAPQDNSVGNNGQSDMVFPYGVHFKPMVGDFNDSLHYHRERQRAEGHPIFKKAKVKNHPNSRVRNMICWSVCNGNDADFDFTPYLEQPRRIMEFFQGGIHSVCTLWYGLNNVTLGKVEPNNELSNGNVAQKFRESNALGITTLAYIIPPNAMDRHMGNFKIREDAPKCRDNYTSPSAGNLTGSQLPFTSEHPRASVQADLSADNNGFMYPNGFTWLNADNNRELAQYYGRLFRGKGVAGCYHDVDGLWTGNNSEAADLAPEVRGPGGAGFHEGLNEFRNMVNEEIGNDAITAIEWPGEFHLPQATITHYAMAGSHTLSQPFPGLNLNVPGINGPLALYGEYVMAGTFTDMGAGPSGAMDAIFGGASVTEGGFMFIYSTYAMCGMRMPISMFWFVDPIAEYFIPEPGEFYYDSGPFLARQNFYEMCRNLWWKKPDFTRRFFGGIRMFESPDNSFVRDGTEKRIADNVSGHLTAPTNPLMTQGFYDPDADQIGILCNNYSLTTPGVWSETFTPGTRGWYPLNTGPREVWLFDLTNDTVTRLADHPGGAYTVPAIAVPTNTQMWLILGDLIEPADSVTLQPDEDELADLDLL